MERAIQNCQDASWRADLNVIRLDLHAVRRFDDRHLRVTRKQLGQQAGVPRMLMRYRDERHPRISGHVIQQRLQPACRRPESPARWFRPNCPPHLAARFLLLRQESQRLFSRQLCRQGLCFVRTPSSSPLPMLHGSGVLANPTSRPSESK
jgi:hypothetical protein